MRTGEFHGTRRETYRHAGLTMAETEYVPGHHLPEHAHEHPFFKEDLKRGSRDCIPTSLVFYPEHEPHEEAFAEDACGALGDPNESISKIALATGFSDQAHFTWRFKEATGLPPEHIGAW
jgi:AraC-like DNA-binding protein